MTDYWITLQITPQRTQDIRVSAEACQDMIDKIKREGKYSVMAVRPCSKDQTSK
jgi:hypothetical protein